MPLPKPGALLVTGLSPNGLIGFLGVGVENGSGVPCLTALVVLFATFVFLSGAVKPISPVPPAFFIKFFVSISALTLLYAPLLSPGNSLRFIFALFILLVNSFAFFDTSDCFTVGVLAASGLR